MEDGTLSEQDKKKKTFSLEDSIEDLKEFMRERSDLPDDSIESAEADSVLSSFGGKRATEAVEMARKGLAADPANPRLKDWLAFNLYAANEVDEAIALYSELIADDDTNVEQHYYLGNCYFKRGDFSSAINEWKRVVDLAPDTQKGKKALQRLQKVRRRFFEGARVK